MNRNPSSLSIIIPTIGRPSLLAAVDSVWVQLADGDEVLVVFDDAFYEADAENLPFPRGVMTFPCTGCQHNDFGATARNVGLMLARGSHIVWLDDDDQLEPGALDAIRRGIASTPGALHIFRMVQPSGRVLWRRREIESNNVGTPMLVAPRATYLDNGIFWDSEYGHDVRIAERLADSNDPLTDSFLRVEWHEEVVCRVGHVPKPRIRKEAK